MRYLDQMLSAKPGLVAFIDESFETNPETPTGPFYILAAAVVRRSAVKQLSDELLTITSGSIPHASVLWRANKSDELSEVIDWVTLNADQCDVYVVRQKFETADKRGEMRKLCVRGLLTSLGQELGVKLFVLDSSNNKLVDEEDRRIHRDLKNRQILPQDSMMFHQWPVEYPLLAMPDSICWAFRQQITRDDPEWFAGLRAYAKVVEL